MGRRSSSGWSRSGRLSCARRLAGAFGAYGAVALALSCGLPLERVLVGLPRSFAFPVAGPRGSRARERQCVCARRSGRAPIRASGDAGRRGRIPRSRPARADQGLQPSFCAIAAADYGAIPEAPARLDWARVHPRARCAQECQGIVPHRLRLPGARRSRCGGGRGAIGTTPWTPLAPRSAARAGADLLCARGARGTVLLLAGPLPVLGAAVARLRARPGGARGLGSPRGPLASPVGNRRLFRDESGAATSSRSLGRSRGPQGEGVARGSSCRGSRRSTTMGGSSSSTCRRFETGIQCRRERVRSVAWSRGPVVLPAPPRELPPRRDPWAAPR